MSNPVSTPWRFTRSLAGRMTLAVMGAVALALLAATAIGLWQEVGRYAAAKRDGLAATARVFAAASARAAGAGDARGATETLRAIARTPELVYAAIERPDGSVLADQGLAIRLAGDLDLDRGVSRLDLLTSRTAQVRVPVLHNGTEVGTLVLVADTSDLPARLAGLVEASALGSALALIVGFVVAYGLQRSITRPIAALAETMDRVRRDEDYGRAAAIVRDDEVGSLAATFNGLLATVRERDARLARHRDRLEKDVADRTADLREAKEAAEAANGAKSAFLATMSHEIRTPLNGMLVLAELLAGADLPPRQKRQADIVSRSGRSLLAIINDILDFAKVEAGRIDLERIPVRPAEIADTVVCLFAERAREKGLDLAAHVDPGLPGAVLGDPVRLGQVLGNFVNNALKFTPAGAVLVRIAPAPGGLRLSVRDTGIGIAPETLPTIFSAFSQADPSTTRRYGGTGLGLSIVQRLAEAMGGTVGVESAVGAGSTFWAEIPLVPVEGGAAVPARPGPGPAVAVALSGEATGEVLRARLAAAGFPLAKPGDGGAAHLFADASSIAAAGARPAVPGRVVAVAGPGEAEAGAEALVAAGLADAAMRWPLVQDEVGAILAALAGGTPFPGAGGRAAPSRDAWPRFPLARVLVADDNAVNREVAREALARFGITAVATAGDGREAVALCAAGTYDLVLMDASMPMLDGYDAARAIRAWEDAHGRPRMPIVAATAHVVGTAAEAWREAGMDAALTKPFTLRALSDILSRLLAPGSPQAETPAAATPDLGTDGALLDADTLANLDGMARISGGGFARRIVGLFAEHAPAAIGQLRAALAGADAARAAHSLKSMSLNVGGLALSVRLAAIEAEARERGAVPSAEEIEAVAALLDRTVAALRARLPEEAGAARETRLTA